MRLRRVLLSLLLLVAGLGSTTAFHGISRVAATTGATAPLKPARYHVDSRIALLYPGQYVMRNVDPGARLVHGEMAITINALGYLQGAASFTGYDDHGYKSTWVAILYNFQLTASGTMAAELFGPLQTRLFGKLYVQRTKQGDLAGQIALPSTRYAIAWHKNVSL